MRGQGLARHARRLGYRAKSTVVPAHAAAINRLLTPTSEEVARARALVAAFEQAATDAICVPVHEGRRGHPVLFGSDHRDALSGLFGDRGARALLERHPARVIEVEVDSPGIFHDVDTPGDLARARRAR